MSETDKARIRADRRREAKAQEFMGTFFDIPPQDLERGGPAKGHSSLTLRENQPEFYADAPWRLEPDVDAIPLLFLVREANLKKAGKGPWKLTELRVEQEVAGNWSLVASFLPAHLPGVDAGGLIGESYWTHGVPLSLSALHGIQPDRGQVVSLRVIFKGEFPPYRRPDPKPPTRYLQVSLARHGLPLGRAASDGAGRHWFYGDTHYHSACTNDIWEFGNPVGAARDAGHALGLDWLVVTDHSCDLDDLDPPQAGSRFERLRTEIAGLAAADGDFRIIQGEEITLANDEKWYVHMLAIGGLTDLIPGGFWPEGDSILNSIAARLNGLIARWGGYPADAIKRLVGPMLPFKQVLARVPAETLLFAAHPYSPAQPPPKGLWLAGDLDHERLTGHEFWNGRARRKAVATDNPFVEPTWSLPDDVNRVKELRKRVSGEWEAALRRAADTWPAGRGRPGHWPIFIAGSDAHGDFNYSVGVGWDYRQYGFIIDNALGRVRTVVHLPDRPAGGLPGEAEILDALRRGSCLVTDGPVLEMSARQGAELAHMGGVLPVRGAVLVEVTLHTTGEFGPAEQVEVIAYPAQAKRPVHTRIRPGLHRLVEFDGRCGYLRAQVTTTGPDGERFCCFTNPIWLDNATGGPVELNIQVK
jgi:hypothetical protein